MTLRKVHVLLKTLFVFQACLLPFILTSCSQLGFSPEEAPPLQEQQVGQSDLSYTQPYDIRVVQETNDGKLFSLVLELSSEEPYLSTRVGDELNVELSLFDDGVPVWKREQTVRELVLLETFEPVGSLPVNEIVGKQLLLQAPLPRESVSDYQLKLLWGGGGDKGKGNLLRSTAIERGQVICQNPDVDQNEMTADDCTVGFQAEIELVNPYAQPLGNILIDTWYDKEVEGSEATPLHQRATVALEGIVIQPQERISIELELSEPLPVRLEQEGYAPRFSVRNFSLR